MIFSRRSRAGRHAHTPTETWVEEPQAQQDGPWDIADAPPGNRVDLGSLLVPPVDGVEIRLRAAEDGVIQQIELANGANLLQLGVFAAPRSEGIWDEVRWEIRKSLADDGVRADEVAGMWGIELQARVRAPKGLDDLRFIGIDGSRWMIRAVFQGPCAADLSLAGPLWECLRGVVVRRDELARPPREPLPLRLPGQEDPAPAAVQAPSPRARRA